MCMRARRDLEQSCESQCIFGRDSANSSNRNNSTCGIGILPMIHAGEACATILAHPRGERLDRSQTACPSPKLNNVTTDRNLFLERRLIDMKIETLAVHAGHTID